MDFDKTFEPNRTMLQALEERAVLKEEMGKMIEKAKAENRSFSQEEESKWAAKKANVEKLSNEVRELELKELEKALKASEALRGKKISEEDEYALGRSLVALTRNKKSAATREDRAILDKMQQRDGNTLLVSDSTVAIQDPNILNDLILGQHPANYLPALGVRQISIPNYSQWVKLANTVPELQFLPDDNTLVNTVGVSTLNSVKAVKKRGSVLITVSEDAVLDTEGRAERIIQETIRQTIQQSILRTILSGASASNEPIGLDNAAGVQTIDIGGASSTPATFQNYSPLIAAMKKLVEINVPVGMIKGLGNATSWSQIEDLVDTTGQPLQMPRTVSQMPMYYSEAVKNDYGTDPDFYSRMYFGDWTQVLIVTDGTMQVRLDELFRQSHHIGFLASIRYDIVFLRSNNFCILDKIALS